MSEVIPYHRPLELSYTEKTNLYMDMDEILSSGQLTNGKYVRELESKIKKIYPEFEYVLAVSSCTQALILGLYFFQLHTYRDGSISIPYFIWKSVQTACGIVGYDGRYYTDIDLNTWLPIEEFYSKPKNLKTIYLNTFGNIGKSNFDDRDVIYDSSHCLGARLQHKEALAHCISLAPTKIITSGEGGLILTNHKDFYEYTKERRDQCCRMSEIHAIIGLQTLVHLDEVLEWKAELKHYYKHNIDGIFQKIIYNSNNNTIGFLNVNNLKIPEHIETRQYYEPVAYVPNSNAQRVYDQIVCLPSWYGVDYKKIVEDIKNAN